MNHIKKKKHNEGEENKGRERIATKRGQRLPGHVHETMSFQFCAKEIISER